MTTLNLRLPDELHADLKQRAKQNNRSLNAEIVTLLQRARFDSLFEETKQLLNQIPPDSHLLITSKKEKGKGTRLWIKRPPKLK